MTKLVFPHYPRLQRYIDRLNLLVRENLSGVRVVRAFRREGHETDRFQKASLDLSDITIMLNRRMGILMPAIVLVMNLAVVLTLWVGSSAVQNASVSLGDLSAFIQYVTQILSAIQMLGMLFSVLPRAATSADRIVEVLDTAPSVLDVKDAHLPSERTCSGVLSFSNVAYKYPGAQAPVLEQISFTAQPGKTTAIIGSTGSGKSTLLGLMTRSFDVTAGTVSLDGQDVRQWPQEALRARIGVVPQSASLFSGSVRDNLLYGNENATEAQLIQALKTADAWGFVRDLPQGIDARVSQGGKNFSGGQRQRLTIARAMVRQAQVYILDDSFSALDAKTDAKVRNSLRSETKHAALILVTQRVSSILDADQILVLDGGRIVGVGTHQELLANSSVYREIADSQRAASGEVSA